MKYITLILAISFFPAAHASNQGDHEPEALIKYRQDVMTAIRGHNNAIKAIVNGKVPYSNQLAMHMDALEALFKQINVLFPEGSDFGETSAKDEIWDNPEKFRKTVDKSEEAFVKFKMAVNNGDNTATKKAFKQFGKTSCGNCHKSFKKKEDDHDHD